MPEPSKRNGGKLVKTPSEKVVDYRNRRKQRIDSGKPDQWDCKDCAHILATDYLREKLGLLAWLRIAELNGYKFPPKKSNHNEIKNTKG
ncbi:hypothetical protein ACT4XR_20410 (plasmid) [Acinetobacter baumannii]|uniref:hypothetical protein n=1 Tax=Acinetobacter baumannii TaxID=470 RepID=UPI00389292E1